MASLREWQKLIRQANQEISDQKESKIITKSQIFFWESISAWQRTVFAESRYIFI